MAAAISAGCGRVNSGKRIVRIALGQSESHPEYLGLAAFKEHVEKELGDKYEVQVFPNEILGATQKAIELTQTGAIDFVVAGTANLETFAPVYEIFSMPYLFDSTEVYSRVMGDEVMMNGIYESTDKAGFRVLTWYNAGTRNFYAKKPVRTPEDLKGMKLRVSNDPIMNGMVEGLGASPTVVAFGELYSALQTGVVDGAEQPIANYKSNAFPEVANNLILDGHTLGAIQVIITDEAWDKLTENQQAAVMEASKLASEYNRKISEEAENKVLEELKAEGCNVVEVTDKAPWQEACKKVVEENTAAYADLYQQIVDMQ